MAETIYRSPGFFDREIDLSSPSPVIITATPAGVVGPSPVGPAFIPVTVSSLSEFKEKFIGTSNDRYDTYYAAQEFLRYGQALTFVRTLGIGANSTVGDITTTLAQGTARGAGFVITGSTNQNLKAQGAVQFLVANHVVNKTVNGSYPIFIDNQSFSTLTSGGNAKMVRAVLLFPTGSCAQILSHDENYSPANVVDDAATIQSTSTATNYNTFKLVISSSSPGFGTADGYTGIKIFTASLDPASNAYVGKILNTEPALFQTQQHLLYFDLAVENELAYVSSATDSVGLLSGSTKTSTNSALASQTFIDAFGRFDTRYKAARTTSFISQPFGGQEYELFHFETMGDGAATNQLYKVSIANLRRSTDPQNPYGTFTVQVRDFYDDDKNPNVLEQYPNCSLNLDDANFVGKLIGDKKVFYNFDAANSLDRNFVSSGQYPNVSTRVRIVLGNDLINNNIPKTSLPFGFRGMPSQKYTSALKDSDDGSDRSNGPILSNRLIGTLAGSAQSLTSSIAPPVPLRYKVTQGAVNSSPAFTGSAGTQEFADASLYWGVKYDLFPSTTSFLGESAVYQPNTPGAINPLITSLAKSAGIEKLDVVTTGSALDKMNNNKFTLSRVSLYNSKGTGTALAAAVNNLTGTLDQHMVNAIYVRNRDPDVNDGTISDGNQLGSVGTIAGRLTFGTMALISSSSIFNRFSPFMKFTNMFYGGFDGLNILDSDMANMNDKSTSSEFGGKAATSLNIGLNTTANIFAAGTSNSLINSYRAGADIITNPGVSNVNIVTIPGIRDKLITDYASTTTKNYARAIYLMDIPTYTDSGTRIFDKVTIPDVTYTIRQFSGRGINNNYVATYFPDASIFDESSMTSAGKRMRVPSSVIALGALAQNDSKTYPWYAPAGFNRAALSNVVNLAVRLSSADRDSLYDARINPITSFPGLGFVIFGQKTLQIARSALDRVNVRRLLLELARIVTNIGLQFVFEPNTSATRARFVGQLTPQFATIQSQSGVDSFQIVMDDSNNTQQDIEANKLNGRIIIVPTKAVEFIAIDFIITNSGVEFV